MRKEKHHSVDIENGGSECEEAIDSLDGSSNSIERSSDNGRSLLDERFGRGEKAGIGSSREKTRRKTSKPPRPPKMTILAVADQKLVQEMSEHAMLKRARVERMKTFSKKKNRRTTSSNGYFCSLVITIIFCAIIIWHGIFSKSRSSGKLHGSPETDSLVDFHGNLSTDPLPSSFLKQVSGIHGQEEASRAAK